MPVIKIKYQQFYQLSLNEMGSTLVVSLLILLLLTVIGIAANRTSSIEVLIAGNEKTYKQNFYQAEGAAKEEAIILENEDDEEEQRGKTSTRPELHDKDELVERGTVTAQDLKGTGGNRGRAAVEYFSDEEKWDVNTSNTNAILSSLGNNVAIVAIDNGIAKGTRGSSLSMTESAVHSYSILGLSRENRGSVMIEIGYRKRF
ncbi:MAG TPA: hypothetical protein EYP57_00150 [Thermodesulfobacteriaceae bacterium]|nr:hypothetical protein [Thermodesulfobacteriaceae bacterium]